MTHPESITNDLTNEERETHISFTATDRKALEVFTDDPVTYAQLLRKGHTPHQCDGESAHFEIDARWLTWRTVREVSEEELERQRERAKHMREATR